MDRLRAAFPKVEIESCASGGGRIDFEILKRTHRFWTSDSNDAVERTRIQTGFSYFFPPEVMGSHIGPAWCHTSGRGFHPNFRALVAGYGHMGLELDLTAIDSSDMAIFKDAVARHKQSRHLWHNGKFHRILTVDPALMGAAVISEDKNSARLVMMQIDRPRSVSPPHICVPGLDSNTNYQVRLETSPKIAHRASRSFDNPLMQGGFVLSGALLKSVGIQLPVLYAQDRYCPSPGGPMTMSNKCERGALITLDWGTTNVRAALLDKHGHVLEERRGESGVGKYDRAQFEQRFDQLTVGWPPVPAMAAGMVGSRQGWSEAAYLPCPASINDLVQGLHEIAHEGRRIIIVPGVKLDDGTRCDVMRGEESQLAGLLTQISDFSGTVLMPGTHSKWGVGKTTDDLQFLHLYDRRSV